MFYTKKRPTLTSIQGVQSDLFNINNAVEKSSEMMNKMKLSIDISILENKKKIEELETKLDSYTGLQGAYTLKNDMVDMYNLQYLGNFCMFVGILLICALFAVLFKSPIKVASVSSSSGSSSGSSSSASSAKG
jgi:hypothetical protein